jgi:acetoin utilization deacetylase AcuC-like enzyme
MGNPVARVLPFYRDEYLSDALDVGIRHTFDVAKARRIQQALIEVGVVTASDFIAPPAVTEQQLRLVHTSAYLETIQEPAVLARLLMLDPEHPWGERLLTPFLFAAGGTVEAARLALSNRLIAINLGGGFHHAQADKAEGFCAIADVAIAIRALQRQGAVKRVLIVDLDYHHGNGNAEIFAADESVFTFSVHAGNWCWITKEHNCDVVLAAGTEDQEYLAAVGKHLPRILDSFAPDLVVYLAGSDPFVEDQLGDFAISEAGMLARDRLVTTEVWGRGVPMAVVMAGGYGLESWRIHFNYYRWLLAGGAAEGGGG